MNLAEGSIWRLGPVGEWRRAGQFQPGTLNALRDAYGLDPISRVDVDELARRRAAGVQDTTNPHIYDSDFDPDIEPPGAHID